MPYTRLLGAIQTPASAWTEVFRASSEGTTVLRDLVVVNASTAPMTEVALRTRTLQKAGDHWIYYSKSLAVGTVHIDMRQVVLPGQLLEAFTTEAGAYITATGYWFSG